MQHAVHGNELGACFRVTALQQHHTQRRGHQRVAQCRVLGPEGCTPRMREHAQEGLPRDERCGYHGQHQAAHVAEREDEERAAQAHAQP